MRRVLTVLIVLGGVLVLLILIIARLLDASQLSGTDVPLEVAKGLINLAVAIVVTGALSFLFASLLAKQNREQSQHDERIRIITAASQDLKAGFERASLARFILSAHPSAKRLTEQLRSLAEARALLQRVQRERFLRDDPSVDRAIQRMLNYLTDLGMEYKEHYEYIASEALAEEADREKVLQGKEERAKPRSLVPDPRFPKLAAFISDAEGPSNTFQEAYDYVKDWLELQLKSVI